MTIQLKYLLLLLIFPLIAQADAFDWDAESLEISRIEMPTDGGSVLIQLGSLCYADVCEVAATYTSGKLDKQEFLERTITNQKATASLAGDKLKISLVYYPQGADQGVQSTLWFQWKDGRLMQTDRENINIESQ